MYNACVIFLFYIDIISACLRPVFLARVPVLYGKIKSRIIIIIMYVTKTSSFAFATNIIYTSRVSEYIYVMYTFWLLSRSKI